MTSQIREGKSLITIFSLLYLVIFNTKQLLKHRSPSLVHKRNSLKLLILGRICGPKQIIQGREVERTFKAVSKLLF